MKAAGLEETNSGADTQRYSDVTPTVMTQHGDPSPPGQTRVGRLSSVPALSKCVNSGMFVLVCVSCAAILQGMYVNGFVNTSITTIEKRYGLPSRDTGLIASSFDIASTFVSVPVSYFGSRPGASKPRWIAGGLLVMGCGSFIFALPHFVTPLYIQSPAVAVILKEGQTKDLLSPWCNVNSTSQSISKATEDGHLSNYRYVFMLAQVLAGVGSVAIYTLGTAFLDESIPRDVSSLYLGIFFSMGVVGPAFGYGLGGQFLSLYIDTPTVDPNDFSLSSGDDLWLGAWWLGFIFSGLCTLLLAACFSLIPKVIGRAPETPKGVSPHEYSDEVVAAGVTAFQHLNHFKAASLQLLKNKTYLCLSAAETMEGFVIIGLATFMPKIVESMFSMSASSSAVFVGAAAVSLGAGSTFLGGWIVRKMSLSTLQNIKMSVFFSVVGIVLSFNLLLYCPNNEFAGVNTQYQPRQSDALPTLSAACNSRCQCQTVSFTPVCGADGVTYFSACHAGCTHSTIQQNKQMLHNCSCVSPLPPHTPVPSPRVAASLAPQQALLNRCPSNCSHLFPVFLVVFGASLFSFFIIAVPSILCTIRCVSTDLRAYALGLQGIVFRLLGTIPGPILFGLCLDRACILWSNEQQDGSCIAYDNYSLSRYFFSLILAAKLISTFGFSAAYWFYRSSHPHEGKVGVGTGEAPSIPVTDDT